MVIANLLGVFLFLYIIWNKLKADYHYEKVFNLAFTTLVSLLVGFLITLNFLPNLVFWVSIFILIIVINLSVKILKMSFYEVFEGLIIALLPWLSLVYLADTVRNLSVSSFVGFWIILLCIFIFLFLNSFYRTFTWYKSGRVGFSGLVTLFSYFSLRSVFARFFPNMMFVSMGYDLYLSLSAALLILILLYNLGKVKN